MSGKKLKSGLQRWWAAGGPLEIVLEIDPPIIPDPGGAGKGDGG